MATRASLQALADATAAREAANDTAIASVMGPGAIGALITEATSKKFLVDNNLKNKTTGTVKQKKFLEAVMAKLIKPAIEQTAEVCKSTVRDTRIAIIEQAAKGHTGRKVVIAG